MTDPGLRDILLTEGRKQARIHGVDPQCTEVFAEGWRAALEAAQPSVQERERELSLARRELDRLRVDVSNAHYWRDTARQDRDTAQRELVGAKERIKIRDETIRDLREDIAKVREALHIADAEDRTDWQRGYRAAAERGLAFLDVGESGCSLPHMPLPKGGKPTGRKVTIHVRDKALSDLIGGTLDEEVR